MTRVEQTINSKSSNNISMLKSKDEPKVFMARKFDLTKASQSEQDRQAISDSNNLIGSLNNFAKSCEKSKRGYRYENKVDDDSDFEIYSDSKEPIEEQKRVQS